MSKIVCDYCGTLYPENATTCPICGMARPGDPQPVATEEDGRRENEYHYVKGGRFSKANVRKRNKMMQESAMEDYPDIRDPEPEQEDVAYYDEPVRKKNTGLIITIIVLIVAIIFVCGYIAVRMLGLGIPDGKKTDPTETTSSTEATTGDIPCKSLSVSVSSIEFERAGTARLINVNKEPVNSTDVLKFSSSDKSVAKVSSTGKVEAVGSGRAVITVTCGDAEATVDVFCNFDDPTEETTEATEETAPADFRLNREDVTFSSKGSTWLVYNGTIPASKITWKSDDEKVVTVKDGKVEAVGNGKTLVHATYGGTTVSCIFRCNFKQETVTPDIGSGGGISEEGA